MKVAILKIDELRVHELIRRERVEELKKGYPKGGKDKKTNFGG